LKYHSLLNVHVRVSRFVLKSLPLSLSHHVAFSLWWPDVVSFQKRALFFAILGGY